MRFTLSSTEKTKLSEIFGADLRSLAALRIGVGLLILYDLFQRSRDLVAHYTDFGLIPRAVAIKEITNRWVMSFHLMNGTWEIQAILFFLAGIFAVGLLLGYKTRVMTVASWIFLASLQARNPFVNGGGDVMLRIFLFWCMFLPWGARYSVDSAWQAPKEELPKRCLSIATIAFYAQFLYMYWFSVLLKTGPEWRVEGSAMYYALSLDYIVTNLGRFLLEFPTLLKFMTYGVFWFEVIGPVLLISPFFTYQTRIFGICGFSLLHMGILLTLGLGTFPLMNILCMLFFVPPEVWDKVRARFQSQIRLPLSVYYDANCSFCWRSIQLLKALSCFPSRIAAPAQSNPAIEPLMTSNRSWVVENGGARHFGYRGFLAIASASPILSPLMPLFRHTLSRWIGEKLYRYISNHRRVQYSIDSSLSSARVFGLEFSPLTNTVLGSLIIYVLLWNISTVAESGLTLSERVRSIGYVLRLNQKWSMFAPGPAKGDGWYVIPGKLQNGRIVDVLENGKPVHWAKPALISATFKNDHWRKLMEVMRKQTSLFPHYAVYICRDWNRRNGGTEKLLELEIVFLLERTQPNYDYSPVEKITFLKHQCAAEQPFMPSPQQDEGSV
jgi:hypothetical protein